MEEKEKIETCEQFVLSELQKWKERALANEDAKNKLQMLKKIFFVEQNPAGEVQIGVRDEALDPAKDPAALARLALLQGLFGPADAEIDLGALFGGQLVAEKKAEEK